MTGGVALESIERAAAYDLDRPYWRTPVPIQLRKKAPS
jgi:hypothetical protein